MFEVTPSAQEHPLHTIKGMSAQRLSATEAGLEIFLKF